ncbi:MAG: pyridoxamine 5'-phosphate oxidase family protein [Thermoanaerobaculia bacterium]
MSVADKALAYLESHNVMTLATAGSEGLWAAAVFYVNDGWTLFFLSSPRTRHGRNILAGAGVAATIQEDYGRWTAIQGIQLEGEVQRIEGEERDAAIERYAAKFSVTADPAQHEIRQALRKVAWFRLLPRRLHFIDNSLGLGHRDEVPLGQEDGG